MSADRIPVAILGATGLVGQHMIRILADHPWFRIGELAASDASTGHVYRDVARWALASELPADIAGMAVKASHGGFESTLVLSALPSEPARREEPRLARMGSVVCSNASAFRMDPDVPLLVPDVNPGALSLTAGQPWATAGGALITNPNCTVAGLAPVMAAMEAHWGIESATTVTLQAMSGAGIDGLSALSMAGNVIPFIPGEEEKIGAESSKILGRDIPMAVTVNRVPVADGHLAHLFLRLGKPAHPRVVEEALRSVTPAPPARDLPTIPSRTLQVLSPTDRPQPRLDVQAGNGMKVSVGRIRRVPGYDIALTVLVHNLVRGAAGACIANAELAVAAGVFTREGKRGRSGEQGA